MAVPAEEMVPAVAVKLALVEPAGTVTEPCTGSRALLLDSPTAAPPLGAILESVTVQDVDCPELRLVGEQVRPVNAIGAAREINTALLPLYVAETFARLSELIDPAVAVKLTVVDPAGTVTEAGTGSSALSLESKTLAPPAGAALERVTVQTVDCPEKRVEGTQFKPVKLCATRPGTVTANKPTNLNVTSRFTKEFVTRLS